MELEKRVEEWSELVRTDEDEARKLYWKEILPELCRRFQQQYDGVFQDKNLICLVGTSPAPLILTISAVQPEKIFFIYSRETRKYLDEICSFLKLEHSRVSHEVVDSSRPSDTYSAIKKFVDGVKPDQIVLDITGGKKSMVGGAAMVGAILGCTVTYIDSGRYLSELRCPMPGTEKLIVLDNPYDTFGDIWRNRANHLFNHYWYQEALRIYDELQAKVKKGTDLQIRQSLAGMYLNWMNYDFERAIKKCDQALSQIRMHDLFTEFVEILKIQRGILERLANEDRVYWVLNTYFNALRYARQEKYDFAVLLLYRTLETSVAVKLLDYGLESSEPDYTKAPITKEELTERYLKAGKEVYGEFKKSELPPRIGLMDGILILRALDDQYARGLNAKKIYLLAETRNRSVLAHGFSRIKKNEFNDVLKEYTKAINNFIALKGEGKTLTEYEKDFTFIKF